MGAKRGVLGRHPNRMVALIPFIVALIGLLMWVLLTHPIAKRAGEYLFVIGAFWTVAPYAGEVTKLF